MVQFSENEVIIRITPPEHPQEYWECLVGNILDVLQAANDNGRQKMEFEYVYYFLNELSLVVPGIKYIDVDLAADSPVMAELIEKSNKLTAELIERQAKVIAEFYDGDLKRAIALNKTAS